MAKKVSKFAKGLKARQEKQIKEASGGFSFFKSNAKFKKWNPGKGDHFIDVIPYFGGKNDSKESQEDGTYMFMVYVHKRIGVDNQDFVCPKMNKLGDGKCPICDYRKKLKSEGEEWEIWKNYLPKKRELYNVVCVNNEKEIEKGVQVFDVASFYMGEPLEPIMQNPVRPGMKESDSFVRFALETEDGKTIGFRIGEKKTETGTFPEYSGHRFIDRDYDVEDFLESAYILDELIHVPTEKEIYEAFFEEKMEKPKKKPKSMKSQKVEPEEEEDTEEEEISDSKKTEIDTDSMETDELIEFIKEKNIPLDEEISDELKDYDIEDLRFLIEDWIDNQK